MTYNEIKECNLTVHTYLRSLRSICSWGTSHTLIITEMWKMSRLIYTVQNLDIHTSLQLSTSQADIFHDIYLLFNKKVGNILRGWIAGIYALYGTRGTIASPAILGLWRKRLPSQGGLGTWEELRGMDVGNFLRLHDGRTVKRGKVAGFRKRHLSRKLKMTINQSNAYLWTGFTHWAPWTSFTWRSLQQTQWIFTKTSLQSRIARKRVI